MARKKDIRLISIDAQDINSSRIMEVIPKAELNDRTFITVPVGYYALVISGDRVAAKITPCPKKKLTKFVSSDFYGKEFYVIYVSDRPFTSMSWGIGSLPIVYPFLDNAKINVGANGTLLPTMVDAFAFSKVFEKDEGIINQTECVSAITSAFRKCASEVLVDMFIEAAQPIFETEFLVSEMHRRLNSRYCTGRPFDVIDGIGFISATVVSITVSEADKQTVIAKFGNKKKK